MASPGNVISLAVEKPQKPSPKVRERFKIQTFTNRGGSKAWRVTGCDRKGTRVRENFSDLRSAQCRRIELEAEYHAGHSETAMRATKLSHEQIILSEVACVKLGEDWIHLLDAVDGWLKHGRSQSVSDSPRLDDAFEQFCAWLDGCKLRPLSQQNLKRRVNVFVNSVPNMRVADVLPTTIEKFLDARTQVSAKSKDNDRRAVSRFFSWSIERPRRWAAMNPCREVRVEKDEESPPEILTLADCKALLEAAEEYKGGALVNYTAAALFAGLRPFEVSRLSWPQVNLADGEIRLESHQTKTKRSRVISICTTLKQWLEAYQGLSFFPSNWRKDFEVVKEAAGFGTPTDGKPNLKRWPVDVLRHTGISHYFRLTGSYGKAAEQFGNSEAIIKTHYQGRVNSEDTKRFYAILPNKR